MERLKPSKIIIGGPGAISAEQVEYLLTMWPHDRVLEATALEVYAHHLVGQLRQDNMIAWPNEMPHRYAFTVNGRTVKSTESKLAALHTSGLIARLNKPDNLCWAPW